MCLQPDPAFLQRKQQGGSNNGGFIMSSTTDKPNSGHKGTRGPHTLAAEFRTQPIGRIVECKARPRGKQVPSRGPRDKWIASEVEPQLAGSRGTFLGDWE